MKSILTPCLFFTLLSAVASLECYQCVGDEKDCSNPLVKTCAEKEDCCLNSATATSSVDDNGETEPIIVYRKDCYPCSKRMNCTVRVSTMHNLTFDKKINMCQTDLCNKGNPVLKHRHELGENGRVCPACLERKLDRCKDNTKISCWAEETTCLSFVVTRKNGTDEDAENDMIFKGCATPDICQAAKKDFQKSNDEVIHLECKDAPMSEPALERQRRASRFLRSLMP